MAQDAKPEYAYRWYDPETDSDWARKHDGTTVCLRIGQFTAGVEVRCRWELLRTRPARVIGLLPTWDRYAVVVVEWIGEGKKRPKIRVTTFHPDDLVDVITNERVG